MVEVFQTNVLHQESAAMLVALLHNHFGYKANFDLDDCDHILRVENTTGGVEPQPVIDLLYDIGFRASVLPDVVHNSKLPVLIKY